MGEDRDHSDELRFQLEVVCALTENFQGRTTRSFSEFAMNVLQCRRRVISGQEFIPPYQKSSVQRSLHWPLLLVPRTGALLTTHLLAPCSLNRDSRMTLH